MTTTTQHATCSGCQAAIVWATTLGGKRMPLDPEPTMGGNVALVTGPDGSRRARVLTGRELPASRPCYVPHHRTCPAAPEYRARKARTGPKCASCGHPMDPDLARRERWTEHPSCDTPARRAHQEAIARRRAGAA